MLNDLDWIIVPGGPCMSATYLKHGFAGTFAGYKLHYYDPLGAPELKINHVPTIDELVDQIFAVAAAKKFKRFGLITHSFGSYLAMKVLERVGHGIVALIMVSPLPFTADHTKKAFQYLISIIPKPLFKRIYELAEDVNNGPEIFNLFFPYYAAKPTKSLPRIPFDSKLCDQILDQIGNYDNTALLLSCNIPWTSIIGGLDPFYIEKDLLSEHTILISGVGHYPFFEDPAAFAEATKNIEKRLSYKNTK